MGQVSPKFRRATNGHGHWCPGCLEMHVITDSWTFNGNLASPTFSPSVHITGVQTVKVDGQWTGEFVLDASGRPVPRCCHYILTDGVLNYCSDSTHALAGQSVPLPDLPLFMRDD